MRIPIEEMKEVLNRLFTKYNFAPDKAKFLAKVYSESTLDGVNSHGINRVPLFIEYIENGSVKIDTEASLAEAFGSIERWDGNLGPGIINATKCTRFILCVESWWLPNPTRVILVQSRGTLKIAKVVLW